MRKRRHLARNRYWRRASNAKAAGFTPTHPRIFRRKSLNPNTPHAERSDCSTSGRILRVHAQQRPTPLRPATPADSPLDSAVAALAVGVHHIGGRVRAILQTSGSDRARLARSDRAWRSEPRHRPRASAPTPGATPKTFLAPPQRAPAMARTHRLKAAPHPAQARPRYAHRRAIAKPRHAGCASGEAPAARPHPPSSLHRASRTARSRPHPL